VKKHLVTRLVDVGALIIVALVILGFRASWVLMTQLSDLLTGQCAAVEAQVLEQAVQQRLEQINGTDSGGREGMGDGGTPQK
jgi:hypothetical protein